jgi:hypothetical protein
MIHDVVRAVYREGYKIEVTFDDGKKGVIDFTKYLRRGDVFKRFKDMDFFRSFVINRELGILTWQNEIDIAPETLYADAIGAPLPDCAKKTKKPLANKAIHRMTNGRR